MENIVYSKPNCPNCDKTKRLMDELNIEYRDVDLTADPQALATVKAEGFRAAPVVYAANGEKWSGFNPDKIRELA